MSFILTSLEADYDDLNFYASAINPTGLPSAATVDTDNGTLLFSNTGIHVCAIQAQIPHSWCVGTAIEPHVHWCKTTSATGAVMWQLEYKIANIAGIFPASWTVATASTTALTDNNTAEEHLITSFGNIAMTNNTISCGILFKVSRLGDDVLDTYGANCRMIFFDIHYQKDALGSSQQYIK